jgi:hypothetical protein
MNRISLISLQLARSTRMENEPWGLNSMERLIQLQFLPPVRILSDESISVDHDAKQAQVQDHSPNTGIT